MRKPVLGFGLGTAEKLAGAGGLEVREVGAWPEKAQGKGKGKATGLGGPWEERETLGPGANSRRLRCNQTFGRSWETPGLRVPGRGRAGPLWGAASWPRQACARSPAGAAQPRESSVDPGPGPRALALAGVTPGKVWGRGRLRSRACGLGDNASALRTVRELQPAGARCSVCRQCN